MSRRAGTVISWVLLLVGAGFVFIWGIDWGLPSRRVDPFLFGSHQVWSGREIIQLAGGINQDSTVAADVDVDAMPPTGQIVTLNPTDKERAEIVRRYRLFSYQPDEMITLMSLARMKPAEWKQGGFDPKLYQYGGLWIYPVGAMLKAASAVGLIHLTSDLSYYLDHPEEFGRFYVVARFYAVLWALIGVWAVWWIARRLTASSAAAFAAAACYAAMPLVINMAHEAKPHLPGAVLILLAVIAAQKYIDTGRSRWWISAAIACGAAVGMVLWAMWVMVIIPVMVLLRRGWAWRSAGVLTGAAAIAVAVYFLSNPYVAVHLLGDRTVLLSNLRNSAAMYHVGRLWEGLTNSASLVAEGTGPAVAIAGLLGILAMLWPRARSAGFRRAGSSRGTGNAVAWMLGAVSMLVAAQMVAMGAGKPAEYGRFALVLDIWLAVAAVLAVAKSLSDKWLWSISLCLLPLLTLAFGWPYVRAFVGDSGGETSRLQQAQRLRDISQEGAWTMGVFADPAPYCLPPVNLWQWKIVRLPHGMPHGLPWELADGEVLPDVIVRPVDQPVRLGVQGEYLRLPDLGKGWLHYSLITWADKPFEVLVRMQPGRRSVAHLTP